MPSQGMNTWTWQNHDGNKWLDCLRTVIAVWLKASLRSRVCEGGLMYLLGGRRVWHFLRSNILDTTLYTNVQLFYIVIVFSQRIDTIPLTICWGYVLCKTSVQWPLDVLDKLLRLCPWQDNMVMNFTRPWGNVLINTLRSCPSHIFCNLVSLRWHPWQRLMVWDSCLVSVSPSLWRYRPEVNTHRISL